MILDERPLKVPIAAAVRKTVEGHAEIAAAVHAHAQAHADELDAAQARLAAGLTAAPLGAPDGP